MVGVSLGVWLYMEFRQTSWLYLEFTLFLKVVGEIPITKAANLKKSLLNLPNPTIKAVTLPVLRKTP